MTAALARLEPQQALQRLCELRDALVAEEPVSIEMSRFFIEAVDALELGQLRTLDEALGLKCRPGQRHPSAARKMEMRADLVRQVAARFAPAGASQYAAARFVSDEMNRYYRRSWRAHRYRGRGRPEVDTLDDYLFRILNLEERSLSVSAVAEILRAAPPV